MKERPILMSAPMVRAILDGTKTQTRRIVKLPADAVDVVIDPGGTVFGPGPYIKAVRPDDGGPSMHPRLYCPYGYPGDKLWVRETFCLRHPEYHPERGYWYAATDHDVECDKWTPSIHMPRRASRINLCVTDVRVERLQDISEADAKAEGCTGYPHIVDVTAREEFRELWDAINGNRASWSSNPWVWVVEFKRGEEA